MKRLTTKSERKFQRVMHEFGQGKLKSHGEKVTNPQQAQAIAFSEARQIYPNYGMKHEGGAANEPAVKGIFSLDAIEDKKFNGYTFGDDWNGWATPYFERPEANLIMEALGGTYKDGKYLFDDGYGGEEEYQKETIDTVDGPKEVFAIGAYNWTWDNDLMKNGGGITPARAAELAKIYSTGTAKELWGAWTTDNRLHFLMDHSTEYFELMGDDFYKSSKGFSALTYDTLPSPIRKSLLIHHAQGMYSNGGGISRFWDATKKQSKAAYEKSKELDSKGYDKTKQGYQKAKAYTEQKIHDKKKNIALDVLDKTRGNTDTKDQSRILNAASNLVEDQYAGGGGIEGDQVGGFSNGHIKIYLFKNKNKYAVYDGLNSNKLSPDFSDEQQGRSFMQGIEQGIDSDKIPKYVKGRFHLIKINDSIVLRSDRKEVADAYILGFEVGKSGIVSEKNKMKKEGGPIPKILSPAKKKLLDRINTLKATKANAGEAAQKSIQKKIDVLQRQFDYNPSAKERAMANKGKFAMDVPASYSQSIYRKLWGMKIFPRIHKLNNTHSIIVNSKANLNKAYEIYSDMLKEEKEKVPALSKISRKI